MDTISMTPDEIIIKLNKEIDNIQDLWKAERGTVLDELSFLAADIQSCQNEDDISYTFYHHDCTSGTSCDACRIFARIGKIVRMLSDYKETK